MILQRLATAIRKQDWFTVAIETLIVVLGVFLGLQLGNWNEARADRVAYQEALVRFETEVDRNIAELERVIADLGGSTSRAEAAIEALQACEDTEAAVEAINAGIRTTRSTASIQLRRAALEALTNDPVLLSQQSSETREHLADLAFFFDLFAVESSLSEFKPFESPPSFQRSVGIAPPEPPRERTYAGRTYQWGKNFPTVLAVPVSQACEEGELIKQLFYWHFWQQNVSPLSQNALQELQATKAYLEATE